MKHHWRLGSALTAAINYDYIKQVEETPSSPTSICSGVDVSFLGARANATTTNPFRTLDAQVQQATLLGRHQLIVGQQVISQQKSDQCRETITIRGTSVSVPGSFDRSGRDSSYVTYIRDEMQLTSRVHATAGVAYEQTTYNDLSAARVFARDQWDPRVGLSVRAGPSTFVRAAAFRNLNTNFFGSTIGRRRCRGSWSRATSFRPPGATR